MKKVIYIFCLICTCTFLACDDIVGIEDISDKEISVIAPVNNAVLDTLITTFTWDSLEGAESYHLQVAAPGFANTTQVVIDTLLEETSYSKLLSINSYEWRIRAENSGYTTDYITNEFSIEE